LSTTRDHRDNLALRMKLDDWKRSRCEPDWCLPGIKEAAAMMKPERRRREHLQRVGGLGTRSANYSLPSGLEASPSLARSTRTAASG